MSKTQEKTQQQFEAFFSTPVRAYGSLTLEYYEKLLSAQFEIFRSYSEIGIAQARSWLDVKDADSLKKVVESQQKAAKEFGERLQGDTKKVVDLNQEFLQRGQKLAEQNLKSASSQ
ncbi:phasin family protein [Halomonas sp. E19]|uniref:phasin family protein n=1 Tax=unclassified Halomonas TaxID=2609666 RepID=UPI004034B16C